MLAELGSLCVPIARLLLIHRKYDYVAFLYFMIQE